MNPARVRLHRSSKGVKGALFRNVAIYPLVTPWKVSLPAFVPSPFCLR